MSRTKLAALAAAAMMSIALAAPVAAGDGGACARGQGWTPEMPWETGAPDYDGWDITVMTKYESIVNGLEAIYDQASLEDGLKSIDRNGNGIICVKDVYAHSNASDRTQGFYHYVSTVDDNAHAID